MADSKDTSSSRSLPSDIRAHISELDARILALEDSLAAARRERENLQSRLDDYKYPVLTLPVDITTEIFVYFLPDYPERPPITGLLSPALLGQICRDWREIAFGTPRLWRAIHILLSKAGSRVAAQLNVLTTWLSRSTNCSLSLSFETDYTSPKLPDFTAALISQSERWEHIRLVIPCLDLDGLRWLNRPFPLLRELNFGSNHYCATENTIILFHGAPQLKSVVLSVMVNGPRVVLPWSQLTSIDVVRIKPAAAADILRQATAVVKFACTLWMDTAVPGAVPPLIHLESLILRDDHCPPRTEKLLLDALTAPVLRHLTISEYELGEEPLSTIATFLSRSCCSLQSLHADKASLSKTAYCVAFPSIQIIDVKRR
ncbi:hypothetical protein C8J57DRAFT_524224 [Mycena rebaudengoi]|nr:hypothetical protein C8J57DRAFT_524224 [Mycena rebaudengoi]